MPAIYCDPAGNNANNGLSPATAVATPVQAWARAIALLSGATENVQVLFKRGASFNLAAALFINQTHNRAGGHRLVFGAYGESDEKATMTARTRVTGWEVVSGQIVRAACAVDTWDVWSDGFTMQRAVDDGTDAWRVISYDTPTRSMLIPASAVPDVADFDGLLFKFFVGWNISYLPVADIVPDGANYRVTFLEPAAEMEWAKGDLGNPPTLGQAFVPGPYHQIGIRFKWENRREFIRQAGDWALDRANNYIYAKMPNGINVAEFDASGIYIPNGNQTIFSITGAAYNTKAANVDVTDDIAFKHIGYLPPVWNEGWIGYFTGGGFYINAGAVAFRLIGGAITTFNTQSVSVQDCSFSDMSALGIRGFWGNHGHYLARNTFVRMASSCWAYSGALPSGTSSGGTPWVGLDNQPAEAQNIGILAEDNDANEIGYTFPGAAMFFGTWAGGIVRYNRLTDTTDDAISISTGARFFPTWERGWEIRNNDIDGAMKWTTDGAAIYHAGNVSGALPLAAPLLNAATGARIFANRIRNIRRSGLDPSGGFSGAVYTDLGAQGDAVFSNVIEDCDLAFKENASRYHSFVGNRLNRVTTLSNVSYAGVQIYPPGSNTPIAIFPPLANPPSATDLDKFNGTGAYAGAAFKTYYPFAAATDVITTGGVYNSLSRYSDNSDAVVISGVQYGPRALQLWRTAS